MKAYGREPPLPPNPVPRIIDRLMEIGPIEPAGMDRGPISWQSIQAWQALTRTRLRGWEARLLRRLSCDYLAESRAAEEMHRPAPWVPLRRTQADLEAEERAHAALLG